MTAFLFFADETGVHDFTDEGIVRVVGLLGPSSYWTKVFDPQWQAILNSPPHIRYWHTSKAAAIPVDGNTDVHLTDEQIEAKEQALAGVLGDNNNCIRAIVVEMKMTDYQEHVATRVRAPSKYWKKVGDRVDFLDSPTFVALFVATVTALAMADAWNKLIRPDGEPFHVWTVFEEDESKWDKEFDLMEQMHIIRRLATPELRRQIGPTIFVPSKGPLGNTTIQAADLYACTWWRLKAGDNPPAWRELGKITPTVVNVDETRLKEIVAIVNAGKNLGMNL